ncbi:MAG TPA: thioredoxin domain-containing protein [Longimicrobiales bacterium]|nr:thioredoxin domain-containing protein [Longimicrobiales bacterium]
MSSRTSTVALAVAVLFGACTPDDGEPAPRTDDTTADLLSSAAEEASLGPGRPVAPPTQEIDIAVLGHDRGSLVSPVRVVEFSDYGCGYCRKFHEETWPVLVANFVDAGKVEWKFLPFVSGMFKNSTAATTAAECVLEQDEGFFEAMHDRIWHLQGEWKNSADPAPLLRGWAGEVGADMTRFDSCISEDRRGNRVRAATALAQQLGVRGTPTFFVVGYPPLQGALPTETFQQVLDMVYAEATKPGGDR